MLFDDVINLRLFLLGTFPEGVLGGLGLNLMIAALAFVASFVVGHVLALGRLSRITPLRWLCTGYIELVRSVPLLMVLFWFFFALPILFNIRPAPIWAALVALTAYASAYQAEYIRSGIRAVMPGEIEAARSLGLTTLSLWWQVVLPQAHRKMLPTYVSYFTSLFKDSSALYLLGLVDLMQTGLITAERHPGQMLHVYLTVGALFFIVCWSGSRLGQYLEWRLGSHERSESSAASKLPHQSPTRKESQHAHA
ncbi:MAG: amino acid ABC transporter permease [Rhizobacter sp.]